MISVTFYFQTHELIPQGIGYQDYTDQEEMKLDLSKFLFSENQKLSSSFDFNSVERKKYFKEI